MRTSTQNHDHTSQVLKTQEQRDSKLTLEIEAIEEKKGICYCFCFYSAKTELTNHMPAFQCLCVWLAEWADICLHFSVLNEIQTKSQQLQNFMFMLSLKFLLEETRKKKAKIKNERKKSNFKSGAAKASPSYFLALLYCVDVFQQPL